LRSDAPDRFRDWIQHLQLAIPALEDVDVWECPNDRRLFLNLKYRGGLKVPAFSVSDGTLRMLALTVLAYGVEGAATYLVEEPENGIHPRNLELVWQSLSSVYDKQVLLASHSPLLIGLSEPEQLLCFKREEDGAATIVRGSEHPALRTWKREVDLGTFVASGILE
ncbi:MAG: ATP-binding protein, partial [Polyangiaceae bacterium]|nr:ATP-binding protein [Polyangiaceae bacterium]